MLRRTLVARWEVPFHKLRDTFKPKNASFKNLRVNEISLTDIVASREDGLKLSAGLRKSHEGSRDGEFLTVSERRKYMSVREAAQLLGIKDALIDLTPAKIEEAWMRALAKSATSTGVNEADLRTAAGELAAYIGSDVHRKQERMHIERTIDRMKNEVEAEINAPARRRMEWFMQGFGAAAAGVLLFFASIFYVSKQLRAEQVKSITTGARQFAHSAVKGEPDKTQFEIQSRREKLAALRGEAGGDDAAAFELAEGSEPIVVRDRRVASGLDDDLRKLRAGGGTGADVGDLAALSALVAERRAVADEDEELVRLASEENAAMLEDAKAARRELAGVLQHAGAAAGSQLSAVAAATTARSAPLMANLHGRIDAAAAQFDEKVKKRELASFAPSDRLAIAAFHEQEQRALSRREAREREFDEAWTADAVKKKMETMLETNVPRRGTLYVQNFSGVVGEAVSGVGAVPR